MTVRRRVREVEGISFTRTNPAIPANGVWIINSELDRDLSRYAPFDYVCVYNYSASHIVVYPNQDPNKAKVITANGGVEFDMSVADIKIENKAAEIPLGQIEVIFNLKGARADTLAKKIMGVLVK